MAPDIRETRPIEAATALLRRGWLPILFGVLALILGLAGEEGRLALRYDRAAVLSGQAWRLLTGHLVHLGWRHLALNLAGLGLVWALVGPALRGAAWLAVAAGSLAAMAGGFVLLEPQLSWYVGLSGLLHGLFAAGALGLAVGGRRDGQVMLAVLAAKLAFEGLAGPLPMTASAAGGPVVVAAHLYGAAGGFAAAAAWLAVIRRKGRYTPAI